MRGLIVTITRGDLFPYVEHSTVIKIARGQNRKHRAGPDGQVGLTACTQWRRQHLRTGRVCSRA